MRLTPDMKAYKRFPVPEAFERAMAHLPAYDQARVREFVAVLWNVIDTQHDLLATPQTNPCREIMLPQGTGPSGRELDLDRRLRRLEDTVKTLARHALQ